MARPKGSKNKVTGEEEVLTSEEVTLDPVVQKEQFDPGLPENKQRHLR